LHPFATDIAVVFDKGIAAAFTNMLVLVRGFHEFKAAKVGPIKGNKKYQAIRLLVSPGTTHLEDVH